MPVGIGAGPRRRAAPPSIAVLLAAIVVHTPRARGSPVRCRPRPARSGSSPPVRGWRPVVRAGDGDAVRIISCLLMVVARLADERDGSLATSGHLGDRRRRVPPRAALDVVLHVRGTIARFSCRGPQPRPAFSIASTRRRPSLSSSTSSGMGTFRSLAVSLRPVCCIRRQTRRFWSGRMLVRCSFTRSSRSASVRSGAANRPFGSTTSSDSLNPTGRSLGSRAMMLGSCFAVAASCRSVLIWLGATATCMRIRSSSRRWAVCTPACWPRPLCCSWTWMPACRSIPTIGPR